MSSKDNHCKLITHLLLPVVSAYDPARTSTMYMGQGEFHALRPEDLRRGVGFPVGVDIT